MNPSQASKHRGLSQASELEPVFISCKWREIINRACDRFWMKRGMPVYDFRGAIKMDVAGRLGPKAQ